MKNKQVIVGLGIALLAGIAASQSAWAQNVGRPAEGSQFSSAGNRGNSNNSDNLLTGRQALDLNNVVEQNYSGKTNPTQTPYTHGGLDPAYTAPMAPMSVDNAPFPSGQFHYGFPNLKAAPYLGVKGSQTPGMGGMLPNVSTGSVDFNTVDMTGIAPVGMGSPGRGMGAPQQTIPSIPNMGLPSSSASTGSIFNWLNNTFFGP